MNNYNNKTLHFFGRAKFLYFFALGLMLNIAAAGAQEGKKRISFGPGDGPGNGKHIVLVSGDEEYRSEEALPMLARILSEQHGFKTTVLFAIHPETGEIDPEYQENIPGLEQLDSADLMVLFTRFRELPDEQMKYIDEYIKAGKPIVGMRTATHAFNYDQNKDSPYAKYDFRSTASGWEGGFGRQVLGETWVAHHGEHGEEGARGLINGTLSNHAILRGVSDIWGPTDVYTIRNLPDDAKVLVYGQSTHGMTAESALSYDKSVMPVAWIRHYTNEKGNTARIFNTTMGAAVDLVNEDLRRLLVNACYWAIGMDHKIPEKSKVTIPGSYNPTMFGFGNHKTGLTPSDFE